MAKRLLVYVLVILSLALTCTATTYTVGDNAGWDISTDLETWEKNKTFYVGDVLIFQFSSSNSLEEVTQENFNACNTTNVLEAYTNGNTTITLTKPGPMYFIAGNKLYCLGGQKLQVNVENNQAYSPAIAPEAASGSNLPQPSSKSNLPTSSGVVLMHGGWGTLMSVSLGFIMAIVSS